MLSASQRGASASMCTLLAFVALCVADTRAFQDDSRAAWTQETDAGASLQLAGHNGYIRVDLPMKNASRPVGETVRLNCEMTGDPRPRYTWLKDDKPLMKDSRVTIKSTFWGHRLVIRELQPRDAGVYTCVGLNAFGQMNTSMYLRISQLRADSDASSAAKAAKNDAPVDDAELDETGWKGLDFGNLHNEGFCQPFSGSVCSAQLRSKSVVASNRQSLAERERTMDSLFRAIANLDSSRWRCPMHSLLSALCFFAFPTCYNADRVVKPLCASDCRVLVDQACRSEVQFIRENLSDDYDLSVLLDCSRLPNTTAAMCNAIDFSGQQGIKAYGVTDAGPVMESIARVAANDSGETLLIVVPCGVAVVLLFIVALTLAMHLKRRNERRHKTMQVSATHTSSYRAILPSPVPLTGIAIYSADQVCILEEIGDGPYWTVRNGFIRGPARNSSLGLSCKSHTDLRKVLFKVLKDENVRMQQDFYREATIINELEHPNLLTSIGMCKSPWMIVYEHIDGVDLKQFLAQHRASISAERLCNLAQQVAAGVSFLASRNCVHRDVAARNVLVDGNMHCKVNDLGIANARYSSDYLCTTRLMPSGVMSTVLLPIRWMAPESLNTAAFSTESDVWSFGVTAWEIFSFGDTPYGAYSDCEVADIIMKGGTGLALQCPASCPRSVYALLVACWNARPHLRLSLRDVDSQLIALCGEMAALANARALATPATLQFSSFSDTSVLNSCSHCQMDDEQAVCLIHNAKHSAANWNQLGCPLGPDNKSRISSLSGSDKSNRSGLPKSANSDLSNAASSRLVPYYSQLPSDHAASPNCSQQQHALQAQSNLNANANENARIASLGFALASAANGRQQLLAVGHL